MPTVVITGTSRGIGRELAKQYAAQGWEVVATARQPQASSALPLDVADPASVDAFGRDMAGRPVDLLINNAGALGDDQGLANFDPAAWMREMQVNALGALLVTRALLPNLRAGQGRKIANITSRMGSITDNTSGGFYAYRASKAALNAITKSLALDLAPDGIACFCLHPGWVQTAMGGAGAALTPGESAARLRALIGNAGSDATGRFFDTDGAELPW